jgi:hypothetical protein
MDIIFLRREPEIERLGSEKSLTPVFSIALAHLFGPY